MAKVALGQGELRLHKGSVWFVQLLAADPDSYEPEELWTVAMRLWVQGGDLVVSEIRIFPWDENQRTREPGTWRVAKRPPKVFDSWAPEPIPWGGVTRSLLQRVPIESLRKLSRQKQAEAGGALGVELRDLLGDLPSVPTPRKRRDPAWYANLAIEYHHEVKRGSRTPVRAIADRMGARQAQVRDWLHEARRRKFLTKGGQGRAGGMATPEAWRLAAQARAGKGRGKR